MKYFLLFTLVNCIFFAHGQDYYSGCSKTFLKQTADKSIDSVCVEYWADTSYRKLAAKMLKGDTVQATCIILHKSQRERHSIMPSNKDVWYDEKDKRFVTMLFSWTKYYMLFCGKWVRIYEPNPLAKN
jgi:hypothetical protein